MPLRGGSDLNDPRTAQSEWDEGSGDCCWIEYHMSSFGWRQTQHLNLSIQDDQYLFGGATL